MNGTRRIRIRPRVAAALGVAAIAVAAIFLAAGYARKSGVGPRVVETAKGLLAEGKVELAARHLDRYLQANPDDVAAMALLAKIQADTAAGRAQMLSAAKLYGKLLIREPDGPESQEARRRLAGLYIAYSDQVSEIPQENLRGEADVGVRYSSAVEIAKEMISRGDDGAAAYRILGSALDGLAGRNDQKKMGEAAAEYRKALAKDPADVESATRLARLLRDRMQDPAGGDAAMDALLKARPDAGATDAEARMARFEYFRRDRLHPDAAKATAELEAALKLTPNDPRVLLASAYDAVGRNQMKEARLFLDRIESNSKRKNDLIDQYAFRARFLRGMVDLGEANPDAAIDVWRKDLVLTGGTDAELTWWLAFIQLQLGRREEARPLMDQYRRVSGAAGLAPHRFLRAISNYHNQLPAVAVKDLIWADDNGIGASLKDKLQLWLGKCYEAVGKYPEALTAYRRASALSPGWSAPRLAAATLLTSDQRGDEAITELATGLAATPKDARLLLAMAAARLDQQRRLPESRRNWAAFDRAQEQAALVAPANAELALLRADRLALDGRAQEAASMLEEAVGRVPREPAVWLAYAEALIRAGRVPQAIQLLERAAAPDAAGDVATIRIARSNLLDSIGRGRAAREVLAAPAASDQPDQRIRVAAALADLMTRQGDAVEARRAFVELARLVPEDPRPRLAVMRQALTESPVDPARLAESVSLLRDMKKASASAAADPDAAKATPRAAEAESARPATPFDEANLLVEAVLQDSPQLPLAHFVHGLLLERAGRGDDAVTAYKAARARERGGAESTTRLLDLLLSLKRYDEVKEMALARKGDSSVDRAAAEACLRAGQAAPAADFVARAVRAEPASIPVALWQARMLAALGRPGEVGPVLEGLTRRHPENLDAWLALVRYQAGRTPRDDKALAATIEAAKKSVQGRTPELIEARCWQAAGDRVRAESAFGTARARRPGDRDVLVEASSFYRDNNIPALAESCLRDASAVAPGDRLVARELALAVTARPHTPDEWNQAWSLIAAEAPGPDEAEDRLCRAVLLSRCPDATRRQEVAGRIESLLGDLPKASPVAARARDYLARLLVASGRGEAALPTAKASAASGDPAAVAVYAEALIQAKQFEEAGKQVDRLAADHPREAALRVRLARDSAPPDGVAAALEALYRARRDSPDGVAIGREALTVLAAGGPTLLEAATRLGRSLAEQAPALAWIPARFAANRGDLDEALAMCRLATESGSPADRRQVGLVLVQLAAAEPGRKQPDSEARARQIDAALESVVAREPEAQDLLTLRAMLRHTQGRYAEEVAIYRVVYKKEPDNLVARNNLAWALSEGLDQPSEAIDLIDGVIRVAGRAASLLDTRGMILLRLGRLDEAIRDLEEAARLAPNGLHQFHLARAYLKANRVDDARRARDDARKAGFTAAQADPAEQATVEPVLSL